MSFHLDPAWELADSGQIERWLVTVKRYDAREASKLALVLGNKLDIQLLSKMYEKSVRTGTTLLDTVIERLSLFNMSSFGTPESNNSFVTDVTSYIPVSGMVENGADMPRLVPKLISSAVGIKTIKDYCGDYMYAGSFEETKGNGLYHPFDQKTEVVTRQDLVSRGLICVDITTRDKVSKAINSCNHRSREIYARRLAKMLTTVDDDTYTTIELFDKELARLTKYYSTVIS